MHDADVFGKKMQLKDLIALMGDYLTNEKDEIRARGTLLLSEVLTRLTDLPLNVAGVTTVVTFFCDRLKDYAWVPVACTCACQTLPVCSCSKEVLKGLWAVVKIRPLPQGLPSKICARSEWSCALCQCSTVLPPECSMFTNMSVQGLVQSARKHAIDTLCVLCSKYESEVLGMGRDFVAGFIVAMDGEKDPRNLITCFWIATFVLTQFPHQTLAEFYEVSINHTLNRDRLSAAGAQLLNQLAGDAGAV